MPEHPTTKELVIHLHIANAVHSWFMLWSQDQHTRLQSLMFKPYNICSVVDCRVSSSGTIHTSQSNAHSWQGCTVEGTAL
jgi:hypothetical protein